MFYLFSVKKYFKKIQTKYNLFLTLTFTIKVFRDNFLLSIHKIKIYLIRQL